MAQRIDPGEAERIMTAAGLKPLTAYPGYDAPWHCKCENCGREVSPRFHGVKGEGKGCKYCSGNAVVPSEAIEEMKARNLLPLVDFPGASQPWLSRCIVCSTEGKPRLADIRMGHSGCIKCGNLVGTKKRKLSASPIRKGQRKDFAEVLLVMKAANLEPLEPYVTSNTKWKCKCLNCGEIVTPNYHSIVSGRSGCVSCSRAERIGKYRLDESTAIAIMKGKNLEPLEQYPGAMTPWKCKCLDCGNEIQPRYAHIQQGRKGCKYCGIKKNSERIRVSETTPSLSTTHPDLASQSDGWDPDTIISGSHKILSWKCFLGHKWNAQVKSRALNGNNCPTCSGHVVLAGFNDLKTANPVLAKEAYGWDPSTVTPFSGQKVSWKCSSGHISQVKVADRSNGIGCATCSGHRVLEGFNDLATTHPELVEEVDGWDPKTISKGHDKKLPWICQFGHKWKANVYTRTSAIKVGCPTCAKHGFDPNKDGYLYLLSHTNWEMLQIGITNVPDDRIGRHKKSGWELLELRGPMDGHLARQWETAILQMLKGTGADVLNEKIAGKFDGYSEAWSKATLPIESLKELMRLTDEFEENLGKGRRVK